MLVVIISILLYTSNADYLLKTLLPDATLKLFNSLCLRSITSQCFSNNNFWIMLIRNTK